jgi:hypothetical protein
MFHLVRGISGSGSPFRLVLDSHVAINHVFVWILSGVFDRYTDKNDFVAMRPAMKVSSSKNHEAEYKT